MVMNGVSMKQVQEWLGHSTFSTTADIYAHLDYKSKEGSAGVIAGLLETKKVKRPLHSTAVSTNGSISNGFNRQPVKVPVGENLGENGLSK